MDMEIFSDSRYAVNCMTDWVYQWESNGWINSRGEPVVNQDLIRKASRLDDDVDRKRRVAYTWIPRERNQVADEE
jgi:ribonuclease HI